MATLDHYIHEDQEKQLRQALSALFADKQATLQNFKDILADPRLKKYLETFLLADFMPEGGKRKRGAKAAQMSGNLDKVWAAVNTALQRAAAPLTASEVNAVLQQKNPELHADGRATVRFLNQFVVEAKLKVSEAKSLKRKDRRFKLPK